MDRVVDREVHLRLFGQIVFFCYFYNISNFLPFVLSIVFHVQVEFPVRTIPINYRLGDVTIQVKVNLTISMLDDAWISDCICPLCFRQNLRMIFRSIRCVDAICPEQINVLYTVPIVFIDLPFDTIPGALIRGEKDIFLGIVRYPEILSQAPFDLSFFFEARRSSRNRPPIFLRILERILGRSHDAYRVAGNQGEPKTRIKRSHVVRSIFRALVAGKEDSP